MKRLFAALLTAVCLLIACQTAEVPSPTTSSRKGADSAAIYQQMAYQAMFADSLAQAESLAYRAFMLSNDSTLECGALSLLCYIYYREGKQEQLRLLMQTVSPATYMNVMEVQLQVDQVKASRERQYYASAIILLVLLSAGIGLWYYLRIKSLTRLYEQRMSKARREMADVGETKAGIDVLYAIINDHNISQMGKQEEQAALKALPLIDTSLSTVLSKASSPLTPKETFFCIMEYYGKSDKQKARSFCCSEQAVRSTKSRLNKKIDIAILHSE